MKEPFVLPSISNEQQTERGGASRVTSDYYVVRVPSEAGDVLLHPLEHLTLVPQAVVGCQEVAVGKETVHADSVIEGDDNNIISARSDQAAGIIVGIAQRIEASALEKDKDGEI